MRAIIAVIAALGGGLLIAAFVVSAVHGDAPAAYWLLLGPLPFLAIGLAGFLLPLLEAVSLANIALSGGPPGSEAPVLFRALYVPALAPLGGSAGGVRRPTSATA